jgi:hypothetical protein
MTGYKPTYYTPVIAPPPEINPAPPIPCTDPATDYAALTAAHALTLTPAGDAALTITLDAGVNPRLLAMTGGSISYIPRNADYTLPDGRRLRIDKSRVAMQAGTLVLQVWLADQLELALLAGKQVRNVAYIALENADPNAVENAMAALVLIAKDIELISGSGLSPLTSTRAAIEASFMTNFMTGKTSLFVRGGSAVGEAAASPTSFNATETTLAFFDEAGCADSASSFLRALPLIAGNRWLNHPLIAALPPTLAAAPPYKAGFFEYEGPLLNHGGDDYFTQGIAYYPAQSDGENAPFALSPANAPIVFIAHGNHAAYSDPTRPDIEDVVHATARPVRTLLFGASRFVQLLDGRWVPAGWTKVLGVDEWVQFPFERFMKGFSRRPGWVEIRNDKGYTYFQEALARSGIISVSVNCNLASAGWGPRNILTRAELIRSSIAYFQQLAVSGSILAGRIDFSRTGLFGHSRGGEAVVAVAKSAGTGVTIRGVVSLGPTDERATDRNPGHAFMTLLPAADNDTRNNSGAVFYDRADAKPFKSQAYVYAANHNYFNRAWKRPDNKTELTVLSRDEHERLLVAYGLPFFRFTLLGDTTSVDVLTGTTRPAGAATCAVHLSFAADDQVVRPIENYQGGAATGVSTDAFHVVRQDDQDQGRQSPTSYYGETTFLMVQTLAIQGRYRCPIQPPQTFRGFEVWLRAAEYYERTAAFPAAASGFELGLEDGKGVIAFLDVDAIGGLPRPYLRKLHDDTHWKVDLTKSMLETFRFPVARFLTVEPTLDPDQIAAVILRFSRGDARTFIFDDLCVVDPGRPIQ